MNLFNKLGNTILFYADKNGNAVFKNFCVFKNDGNLYKLNLTKLEVGKILEFRFKLNKWLNFLTVFAVILGYFTFLKFNPTLKNILITELFVIVLIYCFRFICAYIYDSKLHNLFGKYEVVDFKPHLKSEQVKSAKYNVYFKVLVVAVFVVIYSFPSFIYKFAIKKCITLKRPNYNFAIKLAKNYNVLYPKSVQVLELDAYAKYMTTDYEGAIDDYKLILDITGKSFNKKDFERFSNLLYLEKKTNGSETAIDTFNEYYTKKRMSVLDSIKMLWLKSIFSIENHKYDSVIYDYHEFEESLNSDDIKHKFYLDCDKAYMYYLMGEYQQAIKKYNEVIEFVKENSKEYNAELKVLYAERGFAKWKLDDIQGKNRDFSASGIDLEKINAYEPSYQSLGFISPIKSKSKHK